MNVFQIGETVVITHTVQRKVANVWTDYDPATSVKVSVYDPTGVIDVTAASMTKDSTGYYHYDYQSAGKSAGTYRARVTDTDATRITNKDGFFQLEV